MLDFHSLASSSAGCCYRLSGGGASEPILIDAGIRFEHIRQGLNFSVTQLAGCLLSHAHGDHCKSVPNLIGAAVDVYASDETWKSPFLASVADHHRARRVSAREDFRVGDWTVMPFEAVHDQPGTLGFIIAGPTAGKLLYLTDSAYSLYKFADLTHIAIECNWSTDLIKQSSADGIVHGQRYQRTVRTHMSLERLIDMLKANDLTKVEAIFLLHLSSENSDAEGFKRAVERATGKPVYVMAEVGA